MVTDISAADLRSWSGAGPLPRARSQPGSGSAAKMTHVVETAVRVEAWEVKLRESVPPTCLAIQSLALLCASQDICFLVLLSAF